VGESSEWGIPWSGRVLGVGESSEWKSLRGGRVLGVEEFVIIENSDWARKSNLKNTVFKT
jgi:hypothetical protein